MIPFQRSHDSTVWQSILIRPARRPSVRTYHHAHFPFFSNFWCLPMISPSSFRSLHYSWGHHGDTVATNIRYYQCCEKNCFDAQQFWEQKFSTSQTASLTLLFFSIISYHFLLESLIEIWWNESKIVSSIALLVPSTSAYDVLEPLWKYQSDVKSLMLLFVNGLRCHQLVASVQLVLLVCFSLLEAIFKL